MRWEAPGWQCSVAGAPNDEIILFWSASSSRWPHCWLFGWSKLPECHSEAPNNSYGSMARHLRREAMHKGWGMDDTCEVKVADKWVLVTIDYALQLPPERVKRCPECQTLVRALNASADGTIRAHFEHIDPPKGCSRTRTVPFAGTSSRPPRAVH